MLDHLFSNQTIMLSFDADALLFEKLEQVAKTNATVVEVNSSDTLLLSKVLHLFPGLRIGAGGITDTQQLEDCYQAGVHFTTSPGFLPALCQTANVYSMNYMPGVATLSEAMQAMAVGCHTVRLLPATLSLCSLLSNYLPLLRLFPADIEWDKAEQFLSVPSVAAINIHNPDIERLNILSSGVPV